MTPVTISVRDGSEYFRGLLLLLRVDRVLSESEIMLMKRIGSSLGFEPGFCDGAIRDVLENRYLPDAVPQFAAPELAAMFLRDGLAIALADGNVHPSEEAWLSAVADRNGLAPGWLDDERRKIAARTGPPEPLEADRLSVRYS
jgi:hypothetical protein